MEDWAYPMGIQPKGTDDLISAAVAAERARIRRELLGWFCSERSEPERADRFLAALDRICPEG